MGLNNDGFGTLFTYVYDGGSGGSAGFTTISNGGVIQGTYSGSVYCEGDVSVNAPVHVKGNLWIQGQIVDSGRNQITVDGDVYSNSWDLTPASTSLPQSNITIGGDFNYHSFLWPQTGGSAAIFRVAGDVIGSIGSGGSPFDAYGIDGTGSPGAQIIVYGDWMSGRVDLSGGDSISLELPGTGGNVTIYGNMQVNGYFDVFGGDGASGLNAATGGDVEVYGDLVVAGDMNLGGGYGHSSDGGNGGSLEVIGNVNCANLWFKGGSGDHNGSNGGYLSVNGNLIAGNLTFRGGRGYSGYGGNGGSINVRGSVISDDLNVTGRTGTVGHGGDGGSISVGSYVVCSDLKAPGGNCTDGFGGQGGTVSITGHCYSDDISMSGGDGINQQSGSGGLLTVVGNLFANNLELYAGSSTNASASDGGGAIIFGSCFLQYFDASGGSCQSTVNGDIAGSGGYLECIDLFSGGTLYLNGGSRSGVTTASNLSATSPDGGFLGFFTAFVNVIEMRGGTVNCALANAAGGDGGSILSYGSFSAQSVDIYGGESLGNDGGTGGVLSSVGQVNILDMDASGGASNSSDSVSATVNGGGSPDISLSGGGFIGTLRAQDGDGDGSQPSDSVKLLLSGYCTFNSIDLPARLNSWIASNENLPAVLRIGYLVSKNTLNDFAGVESIDISSDITSSMFSTVSRTGVSDWFKHSGTTIMGG